MSESIQTQTPTCNDCGKHLEFADIQEIGRPVWYCDNCEDTQVGPFV